MRKFITALFIAATMASSAFISKAEASITYDIFDQIGAFTVTGTVTTDGTIGLVGAGSLLNWNISLNKNGTSVNTLINGNSFIDGALTASATVLTLNHDDLAARFGIIAFGGSYLWCAGAPCDSNHWPASYVVTSQGNAYALRSGVVEYGTLAVPAVPEPSTWALTLIGFAGVGYLGYRNSRRHRAQGGLTTA